MYIWYDTSMIWYDMIWYDMILWYAYIPFLLDPLLDPIFVPNCQVPGVGEHHPAARLHARWGGAEGRREGGPGKPRHRGGTIYAPEKWWEITEKWWEITEKWWEHDGNMMGKWCKLVEERLQNDENWANNQILSIKTKHGELGNLS